MFPKQYFQSLEYGNNGDSETLTAIINGDTYIAHCTVGLIQHGSTSFPLITQPLMEMKRWQQVSDDREDGTEVVYQYTNRTKLMKDYFTQPLSVTYVTGRPHQIVLQ